MQTAEIKGVLGKKPVSWISGVITGALLRRQVQIQPFLWDATYSKSARNVTCAAGWAALSLVAFAKNLFGFLTINLLSNWECLVSSKLWSTGNKSHLSKLKSYRRWHAHFGNQFKAYSIKKNKAYSFYLALHFSLWKKKEVILKRNTVEFFTAGSKEWCSDGCNFLMTKLNIRFQKAGELKSHVILCWWSSDGQEYQGYHIHQCISG